MLKEFIKLILFLQSITLWNYSFNVNLKIQLEMIKINVLLLICCINPNLRDKQMGLLRSKEIRE